MNPLAPSSAYPELSALLSPIFGSAVPDLRGLFLRGLGGNSAALGEYQHYEIQAHHHTYQWRWVWAEGNDNDVSRMGPGTGHSSKTDDEGGVETRPMNRAVRYLIRAYP